MQKFENRIRLTEVTENNGCDLGRSPILFVLDDDGL